MWAATSLLWARIRARMAFMAFTELLTCTTLLTPRSRLLLRRPRRSTRGLLWGMA
jgi:hypothetical protein